MAPGSATAYTPLGQDVAQEVTQFIAQGQATAASAPSVQGQWLALQAARQLLEEQRKAEGKSASLSGAAAAGRGEAARAASGAVDAPLSLTAQQQAFLRQITPWAEQAAQQLGVSPRSVMAHAALESGWGQRPVRTADGQDSLNLFGIKARGGWQGEQAQALTTEYIDGVAQQQTQPFRRYRSLEGTFADYVELLGRNPRYRNALNTGSDVRAFASALAAGGYATDPQYADKLVQVSRAIPSPL